MGDKIEKSEVGGACNAYGVRRGVCRILVGKPERKRPLVSPLRRWEDNVKMDLQEVGYVRLDWIELAKDRDRWRALMNAVMYLGVPKLREISSLSENRLTSQEGLCSME